MNKEKPSLYQVNITYKCNKNCSYCYAKGLLEDYSHDMGLEDFKTLLGWFKSNSVNSINILGGEPSLHASIGEMLDHACKEGFRITLFSNALFPQEFLEHVDKISAFLINYNHENTYTKEEYGLLQKNLGYLKQKNKEITLAFNITEGITSCDYVIEAAKKYGAKRINMDFAIPNSLKNNEHIPLTSFAANKEKINKFLKNMKENGLKVKFTRPLPRCVFEKELKENKEVFYLTCSVGQKIVSINPDLTIFPCLSVFFKGPKITRFKTFKDVTSFYKEAIDDVKWNRHAYPECESCVYLKRKKCQGTCLCYKCTEFQTLEKPDYKLLSQYNLEQAKPFIEQADKAVSQLNDTFGKPKKKFKIYLFNNKKDLKYYSGTYFYPDWVTGFVSKNNYYQYEPKTEKRIVHEIAHVYIGNIKQEEIPLWLEEGFCEYLVYKDDADSRLKQIMKKKSLIPFSKLFERNELSLLKYDKDPLDKNIAYAQSSSMINYLLKKFGADTVTKLFKNDSKNFNEHFKKLTKQKFSNIEKEWLNNLKK